MEALLDQQELYFQPLSGEFDVERVAEIIAPLGFSYRDEAVPAIFLVFDDAESRDVCRERRRQDPNSELPYVLLISVEPEEILVDQFGGPQFREYSRTFLTWLIANYKCRVRNEEGTDLTDAISKTGPIT